VAIDYRLTTTRYVKPGVYIGQVYIPRPVASLDIPRIPCYIGRGWESRLLQDFPLDRSFVQAEYVAFVTSTAPYRAVLDFPVDTRFTGESNRIRLYKGLTEQEEIDPRFYTFLEDVSGDLRILQLSSEGFDQTANYYIDYQSTAVEVPDRYGQIAEITGTERILRVGRNPNTRTYEEDIDFEVITELIGPGRIGPEPFTARIPEPVLALHPDSKYKGVTRKYTVLVENETTVSTPLFTSGLTYVTTGGGDMVIDDPSDYTGGTAGTLTLTISNFQLVGPSGGPEFDVTPSGLHTGPAVAITNTTNENVEVVAGTGLYCSFSDLSNFNNGETILIVIAISPKSVLDISWWSDDPQGASGVFVVDYYNTTINSVQYPRDRIPLENGVYLAFSDLEDFDPSDEFELDAINTDSLNWDMERETSEIITSGDIFYDHAGSVVGTRRTFYLFVSETQLTDVMGVYNADTGAPIPFSWISGTPYISFSSDPGVDVRADYSYRNAPEPGQGYYLTVQYTRPDEAYNAVTFVTRDTWRDEIGYPTSENHLSVMLDHAYESFGFLGTCAFIQVQDLDGDGTYNNIDYRNAINSARYNKEITDLVVLGNHGVRDTLYQVMIERNDPFEGKESLAWVGFPVGTEIGFSNDEEGTLVSFSDTFQVYGDQPRGLFVLMANNWAKRSFYQEDRTIARVTLDGSFIAGAMAALRASFDMPHETELRKIIPGYDDLQNFDEEEQRRIGGVGYSFLERKNGFNRIIDTQTIDFSAPDYHEINAMAQKQFCTKYIRRELDRLVIGVVPMSVEHGVFLIRAALAGLLRVLVSRQIIAPYSDDASAGVSTATSRDLDPNSDIIVFRDEVDPTLYHVQYWFVLRYAIKRVFGVYSVDVNAFKSSS